MSEEGKEPLPLQETQMAGFIIHKLPRPDAETILYAHSLCVEDLKEFISQGKRFSRDDAPAEAHAAYRAIGRPDLIDRPFASLTAYIAETFQGRATQGLYGQGSNLGLIMNWDSIKNRVLIFNGDVATLGRDLLDGKIVPADVKSIWGPETVLATRLRELAKNSRYPQTEPRLRGIAFEARLFEGIAPADVSHIHVKSRLDEEAMAAASELEELCEKRE